ncbi:hypothetical protein BV20DRAFT_67176 [Pilatotrama ljubarskyi]|nr:hypothetical protein BV20DRAFT_67176 [Pilatotrama ljubarskyi]
MATLTEDMHGWEGAVGMVGTDFCSSEHTFDEENASDDSKQRRIKQGCGVGGRVVNARTWRRKAYVRFLRYLDHLLDLEARGRLTSLPAFVQLKSAITQSNLALQQGVEGQPPAKKVKLDDDTLKDLIRQGKGGGKRPKGAFHAAYTKGNPRAPVSKLLPTEGMVRKSWIEERRVKGESEIAMRKDPDFWRTCKITDDMLQPHDVALLAEVPDDSEEECNDGQTNDGQEQEE